ncbi:MAG: thiosulfate oxidation carrier complex protein SoxZ [Gallionella sp.]|nr:thiosulfate oxidation carrier complex protein SoxZ [Gallionella sp.]
MGSPTKIRATAKDDITEVKILMQHEMENGRRKDDEGNLIPAKYITEVAVRHNDRIVLECQFGTAVSKDPYLIFRFKGGKQGEKISVNWIDNKGDNRLDEAVIG